MKIHVGIAAAVAAWLGLLGVSAARAQTVAPPAGAGVRQVVVVFKTHFDIGYTDMASNVVRRYRTTMMDDALKVVEQNRTLPPEQQFVWTLPGWPLSKIMEDGPGQTAARKQNVQRAFKEGRFVVHALPFTTHTELLEIEDLVRGLGWAARLSREAGLPLPRDAKMTDVPCHAWIMPTLLRHAGVDFLHLGCNAASSSPRVPRLFFWEGPDGSRLLTMYTAESYGTGLVPPAGWPYRNWLALIHTGDNHGPPTPAEVQQLLDEAAKKLPGVKVRIGRLSDFADAILAEKADIPVVRGDMPDTWIHGPLSDPQGAKLARNIRPAITTGESLHTLLRIWGLNRPDISSTVAKAFEESLLYGEHTWGGAQYWVTGYGSGTKWGYGERWRADQQAGRFQRLEASWAEHTAYIQIARDLILPPFQADLRALAPAPAQGGAGVLVYNPLPWPRGGFVALEASQKEYAGPSLAGEPLAWSGDSMVFRASSVPPMGVAVFEQGNKISAESPALPSKSARPEAAAIENRFFSVGLDPTRGCIASLVEKTSGRQWVDPKATHGLGQYLYERFDSNQVAAYVKSYVKINADWAVNELGKPAMPPAQQIPYRWAVPKNCQLVITRNPAFAEARMEAAPTEELPHGVTTKVTLYHDQPFLDIEISVKNKPDDPWPEAGWICFPFKIQSPRFRLGRQGSIIDPAADVVPGANRNLFGIATGVAVMDADGHGVGLCPVDTPLVSLDHPGCWKYEPDLVPSQPAVYVNLFNNQWTTNFRLWNHGSWSARVRLWAFDRYDPAEALIVPALEARFPLVAVPVDPAKARALSGRRGLALDRPGTMVTAFGPNPDGPGTLLRLWEMAGRAGACQVRLPDGMKATRALPVNLRGQPLGQANIIENSTLTVPTRPFAPASLILTD